jgi:hypothetical protein
MIDAVVIVGAVQIEADSLLVRSNPLAGFLEAEDVDGPLET